MHADRRTPSNAPPRWYPRSRLFPRDMPIGLSVWLLDAGSLTQRLRHICMGRFGVRVLSQRWTRPGRDEAGALRLRLDAWAWTREVQLLCDEQPWVFARTLIPARTLRGQGRRLTRLGSRPLGQVLFADPKVRRGPVEIARIVAGQRMHQRAFAGFAEPPGAIWGRRSTFWIDGRYPLLVCEIFLPALPVSPTLVDRIGFLP
ncbi:MAG: chorismate lyase [Candidatus Competibacteraceae bacterium]